MVSYAPGVPNWVDLGTTDLADATRFYRALLGWDAQVMPQPEAGGYTMFTRDGSAVAGVGPLMGGDQRPAWTTYVATDDAEAVADRVATAGGNVLAPPVDVFDQGRMALFSDLAGAVFGVWQPGLMPGAGLVGEPGSLCWNELTTREPGDARNFYATVFGWGARDEEMGPVTYTTFLSDDQMVAGMMPMVGDQWPAGLPAHWMVYFAVEDADATAARAAELGGAVSVPPTDIPYGRFTVLNDPQGAVFSVIRLARS